ncbi:MAG: gamma-glutamyl-gamma-aminobutyrate hydrolase family protein [Bdellovibrionaceae bacterium]|nr:gamma-glutamyl-gamma-aminobutyrate hydrolase family protein [Pseudobdellovibrionaceae bacterium]
MLHNFAYRILPLILFANIVEAKMSLVEWHVKGTVVPLILPVRDSETPDQAADRYLKNFNRTPDLIELFLGQTPQLETVEFKELSDDVTVRNRRVLFQANRPGDYTEKEARVISFTKIFSELGERPYLLLVNPGLGLSVHEEREVFDLVYEKFATYAGMGGDDVDPSLSRQENIHTRNTSPARDDAEFRLVKHFIRRGQIEKDESKPSFYFGTCRGSQLASVALGYKLIQDIPVQIGESVAHANDWHSIKLLPTSYNILKSVSSESNAITVNSLHHQSMIFKPGGFLELAALAPDGGVEATEFKNGRGMLLQFHAELMNNSLGYQILSRVVKAKNIPIKGSCRRLFAR